MLTIDDSATPPALEGGHCFILHFRHCRVVSGSLHIAATPL